MSHSKVAKVYAESLLDYAGTRSSLTEMAAEVILIQDALKDSAPLFRVIESPIIKPSDKLEILKQVLAGKLSEGMLGFLKLLAQKNRIESLQEILAAFIDLQDEKEGILRVSVESAVALSEAQLQLVRQGLERRYNKKILFSPVINKDVIGGFILKVGDTIIDASMANKLKELKKKFINTSISLN